MGGRAVCVNAKYGKEGQSHHTWKKIVRRGSITCSDHIWCGRDRGSADEIALEVEIFQD